MPANAHPARIHLAIGSLGHAGMPDGSSSDMGTSDEGFLGLELGPNHPTRTGLLLGELTTDGQFVTGARLQPGFNHRAAEKLFEVRDYRQVLMLADRHDWQAPFIGELGAALVCEHLMGLVPPVRATWLRTMLTEHARISSHLAHLSFVGFRLGDGNLTTTVRLLREQGRQLMLGVSGNRVHPMANRLGGMAFDITATQCAQFTTWAAGAADCAAQIHTRLRNSALGSAIGVLTAEQIDDFGLGGPVSAASGVTRDLRLDAPHLGYPELADELRAADHGPTDGDALSRLCQLALQVQLSSTLVAACEARLSEIDGPVGTKLSKIVKVPESEAYLAIEGPWGPAGFWLVSRAERTPWRLRLRSAGFANVQALEQAMVGCPVDQLDVLVASLGWTSGDLDK